ncbi:MAG: sugar phosphate nucleotidyltransferase [Candidatus Microgenomates bacterium]|jgi:NDP-sugar pyrophosphorylase family protein
MKAVILAGGLGTRLQPFTKIIPKPLLPIGESSVLEIQIHCLKKHGFNDIYIATNYKAKYIETFLGDGSEYGVKITFSRETKPLGTVGPIELLKDQLTEPFLLMNGDILTTFNFKKAYASALKLKANLTVITKEIITPFEFGYVISRGKYITEIREKPQLHHEILAGIYFLKPEIFKFIPKNTYYNMDLLIKSLFHKKQKVGKYLMHDYWLDIGRSDDYKTAQEVFQKHFRKYRNDKKS